MTGPQPPRVEFVPGVGVMVHTTRGDWMGVEPDGGIRRSSDGPAEGYLGAVSLVPASRLDDLAKAHAEHVADLREQRDLERWLVAEARWLLTAPLNVDDPEHLRRRAADARAIYSVGISPAALAVERHLIERANCLDRERAEAEQRDADRQRAEEIVGAMVKAVADTRVQIGGKSPAWMVEAALAGIRAGRAEAAS